MAGVEVSLIQRNGFGTAMPKTIFYKSKSKIIKMILFFWGTAALGALEAAGIIPIQKGVLFVHIAGWLGAILLAVGSIGCIWQLFFLPDSFIEIGPEGIRDKRFSSDLIKWDVIETITELKPALGLGGGFLLKLRPGSEKVFRLSWWRRITNSSKGVIGWKDVCITTQGTTGTFHDLLLAIDGAAPKRLFQQLTK